MQRDENGANKKQLCDLLRPGTREDPTTGRRWHRSLSTARRSVWSGGVPLAGCLGRLVLVWPTGRTCLRRPSCTDSSGTAIRHWNAREDVYKIALLTGSGYGLYIFLEVRRGVRRRGGPGLSCTTNHAMNDMTYNVKFCHHPTQR